MFALDRGGAGGTLWQRLIHNSGGGIYLETAATVTTFLLAGRLYEARARRIAGQAMRDLAAAAASEVCLLEADGTERRVPATRLRPGDRFVVRPGETIAADGEVEFGQTAVDRSMMTGESVPGRGGRGRQRDRRDGRAHRSGGRPRGQRRPRHPAGPADQPGRAGPGAEGGDPAGGRPDLRRVRARGAGLRRGHPGRLAAGRVAGRARVQRRARGADHRLPVRARPGDARRAGGGVRAGAPATGSSSRSTRRSSPRGRSTWWSSTRPGRSPPAGWSWSGVLVGRRRHPGRPAQVRGRGRGGLRALGRGGDQRGRAAGVRPAAAGGGVPGAARARRARHASTAARSSSGAPGCWPSTG